MSGEIKKAVFLINGEQDMMRFGASLSQACEGGEVIFLHGELGTGKTTLVRGFLRKMGHEGAVKSPTYTLVEHYSYNHKTINHFDLYRLGGGEELEYMGIRDYFHRNAICLLEWPERGRGYLPKADIDIKIYYEHEGRRRIHIEPTTHKGIHTFNIVNGLYTASQ